MAEETIKTDVLVVGGGGAGFRTAIGAREQGAQVTLLSKGPLARCGATPMAGADFTLDGASLNTLGFPGEPNDTIEKAFNDIVVQGFQLNNQKLVEHYLAAAPARLKELLDWGMEVKGSEERAIFTSGIGIMDVLSRKAREVGVNMLDDIMLIDLLTQDSRVVGGLALEVKSGRFIRIGAKAVVLAVGGWHKAFWPNTGMRDLSGEGLAMANRAGADLGNMEFVTFCCNVLYQPPVLRGSIATYILAMVCGGELTNTKGEAFLKKYDPFVVEKGTSMEWNKSFVSFATTREVKDGNGTPSGAVYYGLGATPWKKFEEIAQNVMFPNWKYKAMDLGPMAQNLKEGGKVEVGPAVEYFDGGIIVNENFETNLVGLYAAGECTLGVFGANRVFSAITEMLVHGADAGRNAGEYAITVGAVEPDQTVLKEMEVRARKPLERAQGVNPARVRRRLQEEAHRRLGPIRTGAELTGFLEFLEKIKREDLPNLATVAKSPLYNKEWIDALELPNMVHLLEASVRSALLRTESRGVHYREDYPETDNDNWLMETMIKCRDQGLETGTRPITVSSLTPPKGRWPYLEMFKRMMAAHSEVGGHH